MQKLFLFFIMTFLFTFSTLAQNYSETIILIDYEPTATALHAQTQDMLQTVLDKVQETDEVIKIEIIAFADNRNISEERLEPIFSFFKKKGVDSTKLEATTDFSDLHQVQFSIVCSVEEESLPASIKEIEEIEELVVEEEKVVVPKQKQYCAGASKNAQVFTVDYSRVTINGNEGTKIEIIKDDLVHQNGQKVKGPIKVELKEFYSNEDIILADLHTMEGDRVLETAGMLNLKITAKDKPLVLREGKSLKITMPIKEAKATQGMDLYIGSTKDDGAVDWKRERMETSDTNAVNQATFEASSFVKIKYKEIVDSVFYINFRNIKNKKNVISNNPMSRRQILKHTHKEEYFDLALPFIPTPPASRKRVDIDWGGVWINLDRRYKIGVSLPSIKIYPPLPPSVDIMVQVKGVDTEGSQTGAAPKVALMLKDRSVFLRGKFLPSETGELKVVFERVPLGQQAVLVAFLDKGNEMLFANKEIMVKKDLGLQQLEAQQIFKNSLREELATLDVAQ